MPRPSPTVAIVIPTLNEAQNVPLLAERLVQLLAQESFEAIFVDDNSPDGTADVLRALGQSDARIRVIERVGRRGLSSAVIEGVMATSAQFAVVMDADLQHDEALVPQMIAALRDGADLVVASRYGEGGSMGDLPAARQRGSRVATRLARLLKADQLSDPLSGFFACRTDLLRDRVHDLTGVGYKILLDLVSTPGAPLRVTELPYQFRARQHGESKLDSKVLLEFAELLLAKTLGRYLPTKFIMFSLVGALGVGVHFVALSLLFGPLSFVAAQAAATGIAMTGNFLANNAFTYFDRKLRGWALIPGWLSFCAASSIGAAANVGVAAFLFSQVGTVWYLSALAGVVVGAAWNYAVTALYTWKH